MALPSAVTLAGLAVVVSAGVGLLAVASNASDAASPAPTSPAPGRVPSAAHSETAPIARPGVTARRHTAGTPKHAKRVPVVPDVLVDVYNNSGISGLASARAATLQDAGWRVGATDNWYGAIPRSTVYYPGRLKHEAELLAKELHIRRLHSAVAPMKFDRLTVILTSA